MCENGHRFATDELPRAELRQLESMVERIRELLAEMKTETPAYSDDLPTQPGPLDIELG